MPVSMESSFSYVACKARALPSNECRGMRKSRVSTLQSEACLLLKLCLTFLAALRSGLPSMPMAKLCIGYVMPISLESFTNRAATRLESKPPAKSKICYSIVQNI